MTNDRTTDIDVVFETTWTCIRLGAILHRALEVFERSCTGVMSLKMLSRSYLIGLFNYHLHPYGTSGRQAFCMTCHNLVLDT